MVDLPDIPQPVFCLVGKRHARLHFDYDAGDFIVPAGFHFDGATIPWPVWSLIRLSPFDTIVGPAVGHDFLYVTCGRVIRKDGSTTLYSVRQADEYFYHRCQAHNVEMSWLQERLVRRAVIWFGHYDVKKKSDVYKWNEEMLEEYFVRYNTSI